MADEKKPSSPSTPTPPTGGPVVPDPITRPESLRPMKLDFSDRTQSVPMIWLCRNLECSEQIGRAEFRFASDEPKCPKCKSGPTDTPGVRLMALVHLLIPTKGGKIPGQYCKWSLACSPDRDYLATETNNEAATDDIQAANCPECLKKAAALKITKALGSPIAAQAFLKGSS